ncbi:MAG: TonB-dependent receptor [Hyphomonadaceae bacterium]
MSRKGQMRPKLSLALGASIAAFAAGVTGQAAAQDVVEEEIVVTGFRASLEQALDIKRDEVGAVDAIVAEDIADFPDLNLSESIQRIPGVAITRDAGEGRQITVRGLGAQFTRVRINGMEALTTTGSTDATGGNNRDRSFDFNIFASELFNSIVVRKTASAGIEEGSLGATVDLRTSLPFDYDGFNLVASSQLQYNDLSGTTDPRVAFLVSNRWDVGAAGRFGALFSVAYSSRESAEEGASTVRWQAGGFADANNFSGVPTATLNAAFRPRLPRFDVYEHEQERLGITGALQWAPSPSTDFTLSVLYSNFEGSRQETFLQSNLTVGVGGIDIQDAVVENNSIVYAELDDVVIRSELRHDELETEFSQITFEAEHQFSDRLSGRLMIGRSESDHNNPVQTTLLFRAGGAAGFVDGYSYDFRDSPTSPTFGFGFDLTDPLSWGLEEIRLRPQTTNNAYSSFSGDLTFDINDVFTLSGGVNWRDYEFETTERRRWNGVANSTSNIEATIPGFAAGTPIANYSNLITYNGVTWLIPDIDAAAQAWGLYDETIFLLSPLGALANNRSVEEQATGAFLQLDWDSVVSGVPFRGNVGVRYVETEQSSTGRSIIGGVDTPTTVDHSYEDWLPSLNMVIEPVDDLLFRFGASRVMSRAGLGSLNPNPAVSVSGSNRTITAGNPFLEPIRADAYDFSVEWYFSEGGILSLALFHREIDSFVQTVRETGPFTGNPFGLDDSVGIAACGAQYPATCDIIDDPNFYWGFNVPQNTPGGPVSGFEISLQLPMTFLPGILSNTGLLANYTSVESDIDYLDSSGNVTYTGPLTNQSDKSYNLTLYYEDDRFSARVSGAYRSAFPTNLPGRNGNDTEETADSFNVDASARWNINENFALTLEGINLTDEARHDYLTPDNRLSFYHQYGRSYFLGLRYTY